MAAREPALPRHSGRKPGRAACSFGAGGLAGWSVVRAGERARSCGCDRQGCVGWEAFPLVISPGLRANLSTQCYHCKPAHGWDGCARTAGPQETFSSPYSSWLWWLSPETCHNPIAWVCLQWYWDCFCSWMTCATEVDIQLWGGKVKGFGRNWSGDLCSTPPLSGNLRCSPLLPYLWFIAVQNSWVNDWKGTLGPCCMKTLLLG